MEKVVFIATLVLTISLYNEYKVTKIDHGDLIKIQCNCCHKVELYHTKSPKVMGFIMFLKGWDEDSGNLTCKSCRKEMKAKK